MPLHYHPLCPNAPSPTSYLIYLFNQQTFSAKDRREWLRKRPKVPVLVETAVLSMAEYHLLQEAFLDHSFWELHPLVCLFLTESSDHSPFSLRMALCDLALPPQDKWTDGSQRWQPLPPSAPSSLPSILIIKEGCDSSDPNSQNSQGGHWLTTPTSPRDLP